MKNLFNTMKAICVLLMFGFVAVAQAQTLGEPIITFKTNIYDNVGASNQFSLVIGTLEKGQYIDVDCGYGPVEYETEQAVMDESTSSITGTFIECQVSEEGIVKIYGDASQIDYFNASGCYIEEIDISKLTNISVLDLSHNELKGLDLSEMSALQALYLSDNPFSAEFPLKIGGNKPQLAILEMNTVDYLDPTFDLSDYPAMVSFDAYHNLGLTKCDPTGCPNLMRLTIDVTNVESVDVSKNSNLLILNVSNTRVTKLDLSKNSYLTELYCDHRGSFNSEYKIEELDITHNPELKYIFCAGNKLTSLDISKCPKLINVYATDNYLTSFDVSNNPNLYIVEIDKNCLDFATLPIPADTWNTYYYTQRNFPVEKSYKEGVELDFSTRVLREGSTTDAVLYSVSETSPESALPVEAGFYTYENGVLTINAAISDSVYVAFANDLFPDAILRTDKFKVKSEKDYGKDNKAASFNPGVDAGAIISLGIGIDGATVANPKEFMVNFGDGTIHKFTATSSDAPATPNVNGTRVGYGAVEIFVKEGDALTAMVVKDITMFSVDLTASASLRTLCIENAALYSIDLSWNRCLTALDLSGNNFSTLSLAGNNGSYDKNALADIDLSNNKLTDLTLNDLEAIRNIDLSDNQLTSVDFSDADYILTVDLSNNMFETLDFTHCSMMKRLDVSGNLLSEIVMPTENNLEYFACYDNKFTLATLPEHGNLKDENYIYAPQADLIIATKGPGIDLSEQNRVINGIGTVYTWKNAMGRALIEGVDYTEKEGVMVFKNINVGEIVCEMTNAAYPGFTGEKVFKTTPIEAAGMPTNLVATFKTVNDGDFVALSLAAEKEGTALYFGWDGNENLSQYLLGTTYRIFSAETKANTEVKVYTYEPTEKISVFSMTGATLASCDVSKLTDAICISVCEAGLSEISLPQSSTLSELILDGNNFKSFDLSKYPNLRIARLSKNELTSLDVTGNKALQELAVSNNLLNEVKLDNPLLWALYLDNNNFTEIDLRGAPNVSQLTLAYNKLSEIDVDVLPSLRALALNNNFFTFKTLPLHKREYSVYYYNNQAPIEANVVAGKVDLSDQAIVDGTATVYRWFLGAPVVNDYGELEGEELIIDEEFTVTDGVTEFLINLEDVMCVMTNAKLPDVFIYTNLMDAYTAGIDDVQIDVDYNAPVEYYNLQGIRIDNPENGVYIRRQGNAVTKVLVK